MAEELISTIDEGLRTYYKQLGRHDYINTETNKGKFAIYIEEEDLESDIEEEINENDINKCSFPDFDENFPFENANIKDKKEKREKIREIIKEIVENGSYSFKTPKPTKQSKEIAKLTLETVNIADKDVTKAVEPYQRQMKLNINKANAALTHFLAVSQICGYPFMTYIMDSFTDDYVKYHDNDETKGKTLKISEWAKNIPFLNALKEKVKYEPTSVKLEQAMVTYSKRIMQRLTLSPTVKINDDLYDICAYITGVAEYIHNLIEKQLAIPPFQVDLSFVVNVKSSYSESKTNDSDDDEDDNYESENKTVDIGDVVEDIRRFTSAHVETYTAMSGYYEIFRSISNVSKEFRTKLSKLSTSVNNKNKNKDNDMEYKYDPNRYPQNTRFAIFIDRINNKNNENNKNKIILYLYPDDCNKIEEKEKHVPEIGFQLLEQCIIPKQQRISSKTPVNGQLITFMFNIEQQDEIRCYIVWNQGTMRFRGEHMVQVLPLLFENTTHNIEFIVKKKSKDLQQQFNKRIKDKNYDTFYQALRESY